MAIMIPDSCPSKATTGEKRVFALLRDNLPDSFTAWYEPDVAGRFTDFTVAAPDFGLLMLEVKGWYAGQLAEVNDQDVVLHRSEGTEISVERHKHPARQVRECMFALIDRLKHADFGILRHHKGEYTGKLCFPLGHAVILTNIKRSQLDELRLGALFPHEQTICRDELTALEVAGDRQFIKRLKGLITHSFPFDPLTEDQYKTLKAALHREVIVRKKPATVASVHPGQPLLPGAVSLEVLDERQEQAARSLGSGHQVIFGIAGSGKSVLLVARARMFAAERPSKRLLFLCYNRMLANYFADLLADDPSCRAVEISTFHSWAIHVTGLGPRREQPFEEFESELIDKLMRTQEELPDSLKYDAILIDEGHDFRPDWLRCVVARLKGGPEGDLLIAVDGAQSLYGRHSKFTWKSVDINAQGRSRKLSRNYRNTKAIIEFAWQVSQSLLPGSDDAEGLMRVLPEKAARIGPVPIYRACQTVAREIELIDHLINDFKARGLAESEIAILYARNERGRIDSMCERLRQSHDVNWISNKHDPKGVTHSLTKPGVKMLTMHAAKGLEFTGVIVAAVDQLPSPYEPDAVRDGNLFYVALTRATDHLAVTWVGRSEFTDRVLRSNKVKPFDGSNVAGLLPGPVRVKGS